VFLLGIGQIAPRDVAANIATQYLGTMHLQNGRTAVKKCKKSMIDCAIFYPVLHFGDTALHDLSPAKR
jgi:hypothetical protein